MHAGSDHRDLVGLAYPPARSDAGSRTQPAESWAVLSKVLGAVGVLLLLTGLYLAMRPLHVDGVSCGSVYAPDKGITPMQCDTRLDQRMNLVGGMAAGGLVIAVAGFGYAAVRERRTQIGS